MMSKRPADRPASAAELLLQLRRLAGTHFSGGELANRPASGRTVKSIEESSSYVALDDSGPLKEASPSGIAEVGDIDFGSLPPIDVSSMASSNVMRSPLAAQTHSAPSASGRKTAKVTAPSDSQQSVLLGVGLALSIMALLVVVGVTFYQITRNDTAAPQRLKSMEHGKNVIVVGGD